MKKGAETFKHEANMAHKRMKAHNEIFFCFFVFFQVEAFTNENIMKAINFYHYYESYYFFILGEHFKKLYVYNSLKNWGFSCAY